MTNGKNHQFKFKITEQAEQRLSVFSEPKGFKIGVSFKSVEDNGDGTCMLSGAVEYFYINGEEVLNGTGEILALAIGRFVDNALPRIINEALSNSDDYQYDKLTRLFSCKFRYDDYLDNALNAGAWGIEERQLTHSLKKESKQSLLEFSELDGLRLAVTLQTLKKQDTCFEVFGDVKFFEIKGQDFLNALGGRLVAELSSFLEIVTPKAFVGLSEMKAQQNSEHEVHQQ